MLPDKGGQCICKSVWELAQLPGHQLTAPDTGEAYESVGKALMYKPLGIASPDLIDDLRKFPGTLADRRWELPQIAWAMPETEVTPCFWITNSWESDTTQEPKFLWSSLQRLRMDLEKRSNPTPQKMRAVQDQREESNHRIVEALKKSEGFWHAFGGPDFERLKHPTQDVLEAAEAMVARQKQWLESAAAKSVNLGSE